MVPKRPVLTGLLIGAIWMPAAVGSPPESLPLGGDSRLAFATVAEGAAVRVAIDQTVALPETLLHEGAEVAFFPPVTGG
jgi:hypothetical protein